MGGFPFKRQVGAVQAVDGIDLTVHAGRELRPGRRVGLRQVHDRPAAHPAAGAHAAARSRTGARTSRTPPARQLAPDPLRDPDDLPGPVLVAEPAADGRHHHRRADGDQRHQPARRPREAHPGAAGDRRPQPGALQPLPARVLRRSAAAHRRRPRARPRAEADRRGRAGLGAGRLHPGAGRQPAPEGAARAGHRVRLHRARPGRSCGTSRSASR